MELTFTKMHGLGNDFIVIDDRDERVDIDPDAIAWLCDRHFGIGADGLILVRPASMPGADAFMLYYNSDGTTAEMCGNGVRCFAKYLIDRSIVSGESLAVQTLGGLNPIKVEIDERGRMQVATVDMGEPILDGPAVPTSLPGDPVIDAALETSMGTVSITAVSMGNPHAILFVDSVDDAPVETLGPLVECDPAFPKKTNVEFAEMTSDGIIRLRVWERGCGETLACGSGACASVVAASLKGLIGREATVELPGGELFVKWAEDGHVYMSGPASEVFSGTISIDDED